jgi:hypothetical protein
MAAGAIRLGRHEYLDEPLPGWERGEAVGDESPSRGRWQASLSG